MMAKGMSSLLFFTKNSPKKSAQEHNDGNSSHEGNESSLSSSSASHPFCPIPEAAHNPMTENPDSSPPTVKAESSSSRGKKRGSSGYALSENVEGNSSASGTPERNPLSSSGQSGGPAKTKAKYTWQYRHLSSSGLDVMGSSGLKHSPSSRTLQDSNSADSATSAPTSPKNLRQSATTAEVHREAWNGSRIVHAGAIKAGGDNVHGTPRALRVGQGKGPIDTDGGPFSGGSFNGPNNSAATPSRTVTRSLKSGWSSSSASLAGAGPSGTRAMGSTGTVGRSMALMQHASQHSNEQHFDLEEDPSFWQDHNVQVGCSVH